MQNLHRNYSIQSWTACKRRRNGEDEQVVRIDARDDDYNHITFYVYPNEAEAFPLEATVYAAIKTDFMDEVDDVDGDDQSHNEIDLDELLERAE